MRYLILKDGRGTVVWDSRVKKLYRVDEDKAYAIEGSIEVITKFRPYLRLVDESNEMPFEIYDDQDAFLDKMGVKI